MCSVSPVNSKHYYLLAQCGNMRRSSFAQATFVDFVTIKEKIWKIIFFMCLRICGWYSKYQPRVVGKMTAYVEALKRRQSAVTSRGVQHAPSSTKRCIFINTKSVRYRSANIPLSAGHLFQWFHQKVHLVISRT